MDCLTDSEKNYLLHALLSCDTKPAFNFATVQQATGMASHGGARNKLGLILKKLKEKRQLTAAWENDAAASTATPAATTTAPAAAPAAATTDRKRKAKVDDEEDDEEDVPAPKRAKKTKKGAE